jgi:DNA-binding YbaB/EbfC family protein
MAMFDQFKNFSEMFSKMGDVKKTLEEMQKRVGSLKVTASSGAGMVEVTASGDGMIVGVKINSNLFEKDDLPMLQDLILSASNEALKKAREAAAYEMKNMTGFNFGDLPMFPGGNGPV